MRRYRYVQVDVFTEVPFAGNPVVVFPEADGLHDDEMQAIAREMGAKESAFVLSPTDPRADNWLRFFTSHVELPFGGHACIGVHVVLAAEGRFTLQGPLTRVWQQTRIATLPVDLVTNGSGATDRAVMTQATARHGATLDDQRELIATVIGSEPAQIEAELPVQVFSTGMPGLIIPMTSLDALRRVQIHPGLLRDLCRDHLVSGLLAFSTETRDRTYQAHARYFSPLLLGLEDPATGTMCGALGAYLLQKGIYPFEPAASTNHFAIEQGYEVGRPSLVEVEVDIREGHVTEVRVSGQAVITMRGEIALE